MKADRTPLSKIEEGIAAKVASAKFPHATASKRFAHDLGSGYIRELSPRGRRFLAFVAHRFRRQYSLTSAELLWIEEWIDYVPRAETRVAAQPPTIAFESVPQLPLFVSDLAERAR